MMKDDEAGEFALIVRKHYTKATEGDIDVLWDELRGWDLCDVEKAIKQARAALDDRGYRPSPAKIKQVLVRSKGSVRDVNDFRHPRERVVDWIRRQNFRRWQGVERARDAEVIQTHYRECWQAVRDGIAGAADTVGIPKGSDYAIQGMRRCILGWCKNALRELTPRWPESDVEEWARSAVELEDNEDIRVPPLLASADYTTTAPRDAVAALASAAGYETAGYTSPRMVVSTLNDMD